jgi:carbonic anhydrase
MPDEIAAIIAAVMFFGIPIVAILTHHQRKMAELIHRKHGSEISPIVVEEINRLRAEVQQLRSELHETTIALDDVRKLGLASAVEGRLKETN